MISKLNTASHLLFNNLMVRSVNFSNLSNRNERKKGNAQSIGFNVLFKTNILYTADALALPKENKKHVLFIGGNT